MNTALSTMENEEHPKENPIGLLAPMSAIPRNVSSASNVSAASNLSSVSSEDRHKPTAPLKPMEPSLKNKKLESSLLTFAMNHPNWRSNKQQSAVLQGITGMNMPSKTSGSVSGSSTPKRCHQNNDASMNMKHLTVPSTSTAQLGLTFSELLASPHDGMHSRYDADYVEHTNQSESILRFSALSIDKIPNPPNMLSNSHLFNVLQRSNLVQNGTLQQGHLSLAHSQQYSLPSAQSSLQSSSPRQSLHLFGGHQHMMLSEINESDSSPKKQGVDGSQHEDVISASSDIESQHHEEEHATFDGAPYQTLAMQTNIEMEPDLNSTANTIRKLKSDTLP